MKQFIGFDIKSGIVLEPPYFPSMNAMIFRSDAAYTPRFFLPVVGTRRRLAVCVGDLRIPRGRRCSYGTGRLLASAGDEFPLLFLLGPWHDGRTGAVVSETQTRAASEALDGGRAGGVDGGGGSAARDLAKDAQTDAADEAGVDDATMAEAGGTEVDGVGTRGHEALGDVVGGGGAEAQHEVGQQAVQRGDAAGVRIGLDGDKRAARNVGGLLQKGGRAAEGEDVEGDAGMGGGKDGVHGGDVLGGGRVGHGDDEDAGVQAGVGIGVGRRRGRGRLGLGLGGAAVFGLAAADEGRLVDVGEGEREGARQLGGGVVEVAGGGGADEVVDRLQQGRLDLAELRELVGRRPVGVGAGAVGMAAGLLRTGLGRVQPDGTAAVGGDDGDLVGAAEGEVAVGKDEDVGDGLAERQGVGEGGPGAGVGVEDNCQQGGGLLGGSDLVVGRGVDGIHGEEVMRRGERRGRGEEKKRKREEEKRREIQTRDRLWALVPLLDQSTGTPECPLLCTGAKKRALRP